MNTTHEDDDGNSTEAESPDMELFVAPKNGKASRQVVLQYGALKFTDSIDPFKASARESFVKKLAKEWDVDASDFDYLKQLLVEKADEADKLALQVANGAAEEPTDRSAQALADTPTEVIEQAEAFLKNPNMKEELAGDLKKLGIVGEVLLAILLFVIATSRKLATPLSASVSGSSASGKSYTVSTVLSLMPDEDLVRATDITANALYYMPPGSLRHKVVFVGERKHVNPHDEDSTANATLALREMISSAELIKRVAIKTPQGIETVEIRQDGPIAYLDTTTEQEIFDEDATRLLALTTNESSEQTAAIMAHQAQQAAWVTGDPDEREAIRKKYQTAQRLLRKRRVRIGFAGKLKLPAMKVKARRVFPHLLGCIEAVAFLRQFQKKQHDDDHIEATQQDYALAYELLLPVLQRTFAPINERALTLHHILRNKVKEDKPFTLNDCVDLIGVSRTETRNRLNSLVDAGLVEQVGGGKGVQLVFKLVSASKQALIGLDGLLTPAALKDALNAGKKKKTKKVK